MEYEQIIVPNPNVECKPGWCLLYVQDAFGIRPSIVHIDNTALISWQTSTTQHQDTNFPANVWIPIYFSLTDNEAGHIALLNTADGSVYSSSSPTATQPIHHPSIAALIRYYGKDLQGRTRLTYLGWTEDVEDTLVIKGVDMITRENFIQAAEAAGFAWGPDFNYDPNMPLDNFVQLVDGNAPRITKDMENEVADGITGIKNVIGWDGYNSQFVGQRVVTHYPKMVEFWMTQPKAKPPVAALPNQQMADLRGAVTVIANFIKDVIGVQR